MLVYVIIRNSEDQGMDSPEVFEDYDLARKRFIEYVNEEKEYIDYDSEDCCADIEEEDDTNFVYTDDDGRHEVRFYPVNTAK